MHVLLINPGMLRPSFASGDRRAFELIKILSSFGKVSLYQTNGPAISEEPVNTVIEQSGGKIMGGGWKANHFAFLHARFTHVIYEFWNISAACMTLGRHYLPWAQHIVDTVDVHFVRESSAARLKLIDESEVESHKREELAAYMASDRVITVSQEDAEALCNSGLKVPISVVPNIVPILPRTQKMRPRELLFIGGFKHVPNVDGLLWFVHECWALIIRQVSDASLLVIGSCVTPEIAALNGKDGVKIVGYVPDTAVYLDQASVSLAPLRYGGGMKGKVCEALAAAMPLVTTSYGAQGLPLIHGRDAFIADDAKQFAQAVIYCLMNPTEAEQVGLAGQQMIGHICSPAAVKLLAQEMINQSPPRTPSAIGSLKWMVQKRLLQLHAFLRSMAIKWGGKRLKRMINLHA